MPSSSRRSRPTRSIALLISVSTTWPLLPTCFRNSRDRSAEPPATSSTRCPVRTLLTLIAKRFQMRCRPADIKSFMMTYLPATEVNTPATRLALSFSSTVSKPKCVVLLMVFLLLRIAACARSFQLCQIVVPHPILIFTQLNQILPGVQAGIVSVIEGQFDGIAADRLDAGEHHAALA